MIALIICDRTTRERSNETVHVSTVITLLLKSRLHIRNYLVWWQAIISVDRSIPCIIGVGIVTPGWEPVTAIPIVPTAADQEEVRVIRGIPGLVVPCGLVRSVDLVMGALPVIGVLDAIVLVERYADDRRVRAERMAGLLEGVARQRRCAAPRSRRHAW